MNADSGPGLILCERTGRWAASLRRQSLVKRLPLIETRSLAELEEELQRHPQALAGIELALGAETRVVDFLCHIQAAVDARGFVLFGRPEQRPYESICREAGALHFVSTELELLSFGPVLDRYLSDPAFAKLDGDDLPLAERIRGRMPWNGV